MSRVAEGCAERPGTLSHQQRSRFVSAGHLQRLCRAIKQRQREDASNAGPLIWVVDKHEHMSWRRFLSRALSLYPRATEEDFTFKQAADAAGVR